ncbi:MAG TPA: Rrf2 family transcriptional regulator [Dehalococcoidia bacterium]|jgi:Rrf2 family protein|nr:Rrf2 family transcriptional regulator [Dehalococcoidia bacterium]
MRISTKGDYGVRALIELAHHYGEGPIQSAEIAARQRIPEPYLDQLLTTLRKAGFIRSVRGPQGGHALLLPPEEIRLSDVIQALEGSLSPVSHLHDEGHQCRAAHEVWHHVEEATKQILDGVTVRDLAAREREYDRAGGRYVI